MTLVNTQGLSIREYIQLGNTNATDAEIMAAISYVGLDKIIQTPKDLEAKLGYANDEYYRTMERLGFKPTETFIPLSGGQLQRLALAQLLVRVSAQLVILDESNSKLDSEAERRIFRHIKSCCNGKTLILISHRLEIMKEVDRILYMEGGQIVEQGSHEELIEICDGKYRHFINEDH